MTLKINLHGDYLSDWSGVPAWAVGVTVDVNGIIEAWENQPTCSVVDGIWRGCSGAYQMIAKVVEDMDGDPSERIEIANWRDTWRERPGQEER